MLEFINSHKKKISIFVFIFLGVLLLLTLLTRNYVEIDEAYYTKEDVALYIIKYHELPKNYFYASSSDKRDYDGIYGGFIHTYQDELPSELENSSFKECDIYYDGYSLSGGRGTYRLVYTCNTNNVRVFYTEDHYTTFIELTEFNINIVSYLLEILFFISAVGSVLSYVLVYKKNKKEIIIIDKN